MASRRSSRISRTCISTASAPPRSRRPEMFWTVFKFELSYWFRRPLTLLFFALFFLMAFFSTASEAFVGIATGQIHRNAPFVLATAIGVLTAIGQVITTAVAGPA